MLVLCLEKTGFLAPPVWLQSHGTGASHNETKNNEANSSTSVLKWYLNFWTWNHCFEKLQVSVQQIIRHRHRHKPPYLHGTMPVSLSTHSFFFWMEMLTFLYLRLFKLPCLSFKYIEDLAEAEPKYTEISFLINLCK